MVWRALNGNQAIERVRFEVVFAERLPRKVHTEILSSMDDNQAGLGLNKKSPIQISSFDVSMGLPQPLVQPKLVTSWVYQAEVTEGLATEAFIVGEQGFVYETSLYRRWELQLARIQEIAVRSLEVASRAVATARAQLEYIDRFVFEGTATTADPRGVLSTAVCDLLPEGARSGADTWHVHRGWWEGTGRQRLLVNQNCDAQEGVSANGQLIRSIQLYTKADRQYEADVDSHEEVFEDLDHLHERCNQTVADALTPVILFQIGLMGRQRH